MTIDAPTIPVTGWPRKWPSIHLIAAWVAFSLMGSLTISCELFASTTDQGPSATITKNGIAKHGSTKADTGAGHYHYQSPADSDHCADKMRSDLTVSKYLATSTPDPSKKILLASYGDLSTPSLQGTEAIQPYSDPPPVSPPLYLLFHRLLIDHLLA